MDFTNQVLIDSLLLFYLRIVMGMKAVLSCVVKHISIASSVALWTLNGRGGATSGVLPKAAKCCFRQNSSVNSVSFHTQSRFGDLGL